MDAERELTNLMSNQLLDEICIETIYELIKE